ncbi:TRAP transporter small permease [Paenalcaligenes niemegkensis]|uniref:TRAP transporter small permease n=1 Tax=Paenalcaligenes niemegkensis TaxID=2895469 RepID=UPI001EE9270F|nr:TRAP transporter small permease [Paenalcaligenes niemegkensis]MCQ9618179.1 TRAP transporter small permease [Paenalcaligenes niemegkensis]
MKRFLDRLGNGFLALLLGVLVCITVGGVFMRYVMHAPWHWTEEMSGLLMVWIVFIGVFFAERDNENLTINFLTEAMGPRLRQAFFVGISLLSVAVLVVTAWWSWTLAGAVQARMTRILGVSLFWIYVPVTVGFFATALLMLKRLFDRHAHASSAGDTP